MPSDVENRFGPTGYTNKLECQLQAKYPYSLDEQKVREIILNELAKPADKGMVVQLDDAVTALVKEVRSLKDRVAALEGN